MDSVTTRSKSNEDMSKLDPDIVACIRSVVSKEIASLSDFLTKNTKALETNNTLLKKNEDLLTSVSAELGDLRKSVEDISGCIDTVTTRFLPSLATQVKDISSALAMRVLDMDVHSRKWSLIINGLSGDAGEKDDVTRDKCRKLGRDIGVPASETTSFAACHRLRYNAPNSGIILRFTDLADRESWLSRARHLPSVDTGLSFSPDLPPVLRPLKNDLLKLRRELPQEEKRNTRVKYLPSWPYVQLVFKDNSRPPITSPRTKDQVLSDVIGFSPNLRFSLNES